MHAARDFLAGAKLRAFYMLRSDFGEFGRERRFFFGYAMNAVAVPINATTVQGTDSQRQFASWYRPTGSAPSTARR